MLLVKKFILKTEFITLGQFLKATDNIGSGGEAKFFLFEHACFVNDILTKERGKKIYANDIVKIDKEIYVIHHDT